MVAETKERIDFPWYHSPFIGTYIPITSRLQMKAEKDRLSLAYNTFFADLYVHAPLATELVFRFAITGKGTPSEDPKLTLQLCLKSGENLETGAGRRMVIGQERIEISGEDLGGWIRHHGWTLTVDPSARLVWPVFPHNPYANGPEKSLEHAVGALSIPLRLKKGKYIRPGEQELAFSLKTN